MVRDVDIRLFEAYTAIRVKCKCGHTQSIPVYKDFDYCSHCKRKIQNNTRLYFKYKLRKELNK